MVGSNTVIEYNKKEKYIVKNLGSSKNLGYSITKIETLYHVYVQ